MTLELNGLWRLCNICRASLALTPSPFSVSVCFTGRLWAGSQGRLVNITETAIGLRVQAREDLQMLQRRQRQLTMKLIQLNDFKTQRSVASLQYLQGVSGLDSTPFFGLCVFYRASLGWRPEAPCKYRRDGDPAQSPAQRRRAFTAETPETVKLQSHSIR